MPGILVVGLISAGLMSQRVRFSGVFGSSVRKVFLRPHAFSGGPDCPSASGMPGMTWHDVQECLRSFTRPACGSPFVIRAPRS